MNIEQMVDDYIELPIGQLSITGFQCGRFKMAKVIVDGREAGITFRESVLDFFKRPGRNQAIKNGTRYPDYLPVCTPARSLSIEIADYLADMHRRGMQPKTVDATRRTLGFLRFTCGDINAASVDAPHIHRLWELLRWAPRNLMSDPALRRLPFDKVIAKGKRLEVAPLAPATAERHRRFLVAFFNALVRSKAIMGSPMDAFKPVKEDFAIDPNGTIRLFEDAELQKIFSPANFLPWATLPHRWWPPMIALYTGARINEICQLKINDIYEERGTWLFDFRKTIDYDLASNPKLTRNSRQSMKGKGCQRAVPIAPALIEAGFLDFLSDIKATNHGRLFPHLSAGVNRKTKETNARYSQIPVVEFGRYLKTLGFAKGIGYHAFRHTLATELHVKDVSERDIGLITGHAGDSRDRIAVLRKHYLHKRPITTRAKQTEALKHFTPNVALPVYVAGQFAAALADETRFHP